MSKSKEMFYVDNDGRLQDDVLHLDILENPAAKAAAETKAVRSLVEKGWPLDAAKKAVLSE